MIVVKKSNRILGMLIGHFIVEIQDFGGIFMSHL